MYCIGSCAKGQSVATISHSPTLPRAERHDVVDARDVCKVVLVAADTGFVLAVRSRWHSAAGYGTTEGGIVLALSRMARLGITLGGGIGYLVWRSGLTRDDPYDVFRRTHTVPLRI